MPMDLRQAAREFYEGIALRGAFPSWDLGGGGPGRCDTGVDAARRLGAAPGPVGATSRVVAVGGGAVASRASSSTDRGLMATEVGGLCTMGGPFGKRSGCAA